VNSLSEEKADKHVGFKTLALILGLILGVIWTLLKFFYEWVTAETITMDMVANYSIGLIFVYVLWIMFTYLAHMLWKLVFKVEEKYLG